MICGEYEVSDTEEGADVDEPAHKAAEREGIVRLLSRSAGPSPTLFGATYSSLDEHVVGALAESGVTEPFAFGEWVRIYVVTVTQRVEYLRVKDTVADARDWGSITLVAGAGADCDTLVGEFVDGEAGGEFVGWADAFAVGERVGCCAVLEWEQQ